MTTEEINEVLCEYMEPKPASPHGGEGHLSDQHYWKIAWTSEWAWVPNKNLFFSLNEMSKVEAKLQTEGQHHAYLWTVIEEIGFRRELFNATNLLTLLRANAPQRATAAVKIIRPDLMNS